MMHMEAEPTARFVREDAGREVIFVMRASSFLRVWVFPVPSRAAAYTNEACSGGTLEKCPRGLVDRDHEETAYAP